MISVTNLFIAIGLIMAFIIICAFGGLWLGAFIHHRGVSIGSGSKETFSGRVPTGEVFRISGTDELPDEPKQMNLSDELDKTMAARADRFLSTIMGKAA